VKSHRMPTQIPIWTEPSGPTAATLPPADHDQRHLIRTALDRSMLVEAAAGTGKTTELLHRIIAVLAKGPAGVHEIVAVTFTEKAAGELKLRLRTELERARQGTPSPEERHNLEEAIRHLEEAHVNTIHGFCADLLRERPVEAKVDPEFQTLTEADSERLYAEAFDGWLQERLEHPPEGVRRSLRRTAIDGPIERLRRAGCDMLQWRDFPAPWSRPEFNREEEIDALVKLFEQFSDLTADPAKRGDYFFRNTEKARRLSDGIRRLEKARARENGPAQRSARVRDYDGLEAEFVQLVRDRGNNENKAFREACPRAGIDYAHGVSAERVQAIHQSLLEALQRFADKADADLAALLHSELEGSVERYEQLKARLGRLDFLDLLFRTGRMLRSSSEVRAYFQRRFKHIFIDEFQDTDPLQVEILMLLACGDPSVAEWRKAVPAPGKLFIVGDPKQAIYRFRRADVGVYMEVQKLLKEAGAMCLNLTTSFRAVPSLQRAINRAFRPLMNGDASVLQADYVPLSPSRTEDTNELGQPSLVALPIPRPYGMKSLAAYAIEDSLPDAIGAFIDWMLKESGWTVTERDRPQERVPVAARHICLLFRRFESFMAGDMTRDYIEALEARNIPHLLVGGKSFHEREEVETVRVALTAIEWPDDELSVFAVLHGSFFALRDDLLLEYRHRFKHLRPYAFPETVPIQLSPVVEALRLLNQLNRRRNYRPVAETLAELMEATRAYAGFALRPSGEQALANVLHVAELAREYDASGSISFRGFVERLRESADGGEAAEAPILEEGSDGVRLLTLHKAKGLEFPVVILSDVTAKLSRETASRYLDAKRNLCAVSIAGWTPIDLVAHNAEEAKYDHAEGVRVAYVAATRARDLLVVPTIGDDPFEKAWDAVNAWWTSPLNAVVYPTPDRRRLSVPMTGCPPFGEDSVQRRPEGKRRGSDNIQPGLHKFDAELAPAGIVVSGSAGNGPNATGDVDHYGAYRVVWWDPFNLNLDVPRKYGIREHQLLDEGNNELVEQELKRYQEWRGRRDGAIAKASEPSLRVEAATERAGRPEASIELYPVTVVEVARDLQRPASARYGALVHAVLASVKLDADRNDIESVATLQGRILGATPEEVASAASVAEATLQHPVMARALQASNAGQCRREAPITLKGSDGTLIDGVVDIAFLDGGEWTVIDFKTGHELEHRLEHYRRQVRLYAQAIALTTRQKVSVILMRI
jgi:ATP-dependent helicase/nuclease subunit A